METNSYFFFHYKDTPLLVVNTSNIDFVHREADRREHRLSVEEANRLEIQMGYPETDPHGDPIPTPEGELKDMPQLTLSEWETGKPARIVQSDRRQ